MRTFFAAATLQLALLAGPTISPAVPSPVVGRMVKIDNFTFAPQRVTVMAGTTVTWENEDDIPHNIASTTKLFRSKVLDTHESFSFKFTTPGIFEYFCSLHPHIVP